MKHPHLILKEPRRVFICRGPFISDRVGGLAAGAPSQPVASVNCGSGENRATDSNCCHHQQNPHWRKRPNLLGSQQYDFLMPVFVFICLALSLISASTCSATAQQTNNGQEEYLRSCSVCHGQDGDGLGPMASKLQIKPSDLRILAKKNGGIFSTDAVYAKVDGRRATNLQDKSAMPIWGCHHMAPSRIRGSGFEARKILENTRRDAMWRMLNHRRHRKTTKEERNKNRVKATQTESFLDMPCDSEVVIHDRIQSIVDYLRTIQVK